MLFGLAVGMTAVSSCPSGSRSGCSRAIRELRVLLRYAPPDYVPRRWPVRLRPLLGRSRGSGPLRPCYEQAIDSPPIEPDDFEPHARPVYGLSDLRDSPELSQHETRCRPEPSPLVER